MKPKMNLSIKRTNCSITASKPFSLLFLISFLVIVISHGSITEAGSCERPADLKDKMIIGVPANPFSDKFLKWDESINNYTGFCIRVFEQVLKSSKITHNPIQYVEFDGTYDELVECVAKKKFDAVVGDVTITADRWDSVEFTVPFMESQLSMVVPVIQTPKTWMFLMPFTVQMWGATLGILVYTMFIVWFLEHRSDSEFFGERNHQLGNVLWFIFSSIFFAHREEIRSNYTRVVIVVWLFLVLVLTESYNANLTSMLTVGHFQRNAKDIELLKKTNATVACDGNAFVQKYLIDQHDFSEKNIVNITSREENILKIFENGSISAVFLESPYAKVFSNQNCRKYTSTQLSYRFGGFGFVFPKYSSMATEFSKIILDLSENGTLKNLEHDLFAFSPECSNTQSSLNNGMGLSLEGLWGLFLISGATSTMCFLLFIVHLRRNYGCDNLSNAIVSHPPLSVTDPKRDNLSSTRVSHPPFFFVEKIAISDGSKPLSSSNS